MKDKRGVSERESVQFLLDESKETFSRNLSNMDKIDAKFIQLLVLISAIVALFLRFVRLPTGTFRIVLYSVIVFSFLLALLLAFLGYRTNKYNSISINKLIKEYLKGKELIDIKKSVAGTTGENIDKIKEINIKKSRFFDWSFFLIFLGIVLALLLNVLEGGLNV